MLEQPPVGPLAKSFDSRPSLTYVQSSSPFLDHLPCISLVEQDGRVIAANASGIDALGKLPEAGLALDNVLLNPLPGADHRASRPFRSLLLRADGRAVPVNGIAGSIPHGTRTARLLMLAENESAVSPRTLAQGTYLEELLDSAPDAMAITQQGRIVHLNREFARLFGYAIEDCMGQLLDELVLPDGLQHESEILLHMVRRDGRASMETVRRTRSGAYVDVSVLVTPIRADVETASGPIHQGSGFFVTYRDIRSQKELEARWQHTALHDSLTALANRRLFLDRVGLTMARLKRRPDRNFAIVFLDVDRFKQVNDTLGHEAGDALLLEIARRLRLCVRPQDTVARFGGDEFAMLLDDVDSFDGVKGIAERIQSEVQQASTRIETTIAVSASIGICLSDVSYESAEELLRDADTAMYEAKAAGRARYALFEGRARPAQPQPDAAVRQLA